MTHDLHPNFVLSPDDPRLTAYALGELEGDERAAVEAAVQADPALQAAVAELRALTGLLTTALATEASPAIVVKPAARQRRPRGRLIPFPVYYLATAAAACFAVVVFLRQEQPVPRSSSQAEIAQTERSGRLEEKAKSATVTNEAPAVLFAVPMAPPAKDADALAFRQEKQDSRVDLSLTASVPAPLPVTAPAPAPMRMVENGQAGGKARETVDAREGQLKAVPTEVRHRRELQVEAEMLGRSAVQPAPVVTGAIAGKAAAVTDGFVFDRASVPASPSAEAYALRIDSAYRAVEAEPLSTFSIDVDTASYANVRRFLTGGRLPPRDAVRIEELVNYFPYRYAPPAPASTPADAVPFAAHLEVASAPWAPAHRLVRIGLKGREFTAAVARPAANLVFLLDVSGSMNSAQKLPLVKASLRLLVDRLRPDDRVAIVTYAGRSGLALPSTPVAQKRGILAALDELAAAGSTNGALGIHLAYDIAKANFVPGGLNRVILCTDGDFNVGVTSPGELVRLVEEKAKSRVFLSVFGFGMGNLKDATLEQLADKGNGTYGYIDSRREAEKVFVEEVEGTLATIAKDVKIQVEFNPARVQAYRLIGYENRLLNKEDFNNDAVDAGEIGAGHTVTALYEIVPVGVDEDPATSRPTVDPLKYRQTADAGGTEPKVAGGPVSAELLTVKIRYKAPEADVSRKQEFPLVDHGKEFARASGDFQFAAAVAGWGLLLRDSPHKGAATYEQVLAWAESGLGDDAGGYRGEFIQLVRRSQALSQP